MRYALASFAILTLLLPGCKPGADRESDAASAPRIEAQEVDPWLAKFKAKHGSEFNPLSRVDREKMDRLKGASSPGEGVVNKEVTKKKADLLSTSEIDRAAILSVARGLIGQTETHGNNRSPWIDAANKLTGAPMGSPYCASYNAWCYHEGKAPAGWPRSAWSPDWVRSATWTAAKGGLTPKPGDAFGIWGTDSKGNKRIIHTGLTEKWGEASAVTLEGNTSPSAEFGAASDREGDGVWRKRRLTRQIHSVRNWID